MQKYNPEKIEKKWRERWAKDGIYRTEEDPEKPKCYVLDMFPYPSGEGLHVGHPKGYIATDIYSRMKRMQGHAVLHPMGWDAFGLPAENFAIKNKVHPRKAVEKNISRFKEQLDLIGLDYDWDREINTTDPEYYHWTQWIFLKLFEEGLAYESHEPINWCPSCQTGLANEDLEDGACERCGSVVEKRPMRQWVLRITDYAERMLDDLALLPKWPEHIKESQRNWIGRSQGAVLDFEVKSQKSKVKNTDQKIKVFTTRPDTLFGATYMVLAPEHKLVTELIKSQQSIVENVDEILRYIEVSRKKTEIERTAEGKEKTGVELKGIKAINPANKEEIPVFIADYVLAHYGTGAIMAVPAHDERDREFLDEVVTRELRETLPIKYVIEPGDLDEFRKNYFPHYSHEVEPGQTIQDAQKRDEKIIFERLLKAGRGEKFKGEFPGYSGMGKLINSSERFNGLSSDEAKEKITKAVGGEMKTTYRLRDWVFSRQRYWGEPIPIVHCEKCGTVPVPEKDLPVRLPDVEHYEPTGTGESPLASITDWVNVECPKCGGKGKRETNTMPQWAGSSWYYLRYMDPHNDKELVSKERGAYWEPVDMYVGGAEHATRHLIYARFWHKFLYDIKVVTTKEPFTELHSVGLIQAEDGRKMSKRYDNVVNPDEMVGTYGADTLRVYEMFMGPFENTIAWNTDSMIGSRRFLERVWRMQEYVEKEDEPSIETELHKTIQKVTDDINAFKFNTAVSQMMIFMNAAEKIKRIGTSQFEVFMKLLAPFAPHITEELWQKTEKRDSIHIASWPVCDPEKLKAETATIAVQINGKVRATLEMPVSAKKEDVERAALALMQVQKYMGNETAAKVIYVENRLINLVVGT